MTTPWYNAERVQQSGSVVLKRWNAERQAKRVAATSDKTIPISEGVRGSELYDWMTGGLSSAGVTVTERSAMSISTVFACVGLIGGSIASMPFHIYRRTDDGRDRVDSPLWWLLNEEPWPTMPAAVFWEYLITSLLLQGDGFAKIHRKNSRSPDIKGFEPLHPTWVVPVADGDHLLYIVNRPSTEQEIVHQDDMLHVPGIGFDGRRGMSVLRHALQSSGGVALAADRYSAAFFKNGARPDFVLQSDKDVSAANVDLIRETWSQRHQGIDNSHLPAILTGGLKVAPITLNSEDAQLLSTRQYSVEDLARVFGVPTFMVGHHEKSSSWGSGLEQQSIGFVKFTLGRHLVKIQQEVNRKCFRTATYFGEFQTAGLERGDIKSRYESHRIGLGRAGEPGWLTVNEVRRMENMPPIDGGNTLLKGTPDASTSATSDQQPADSTAV